MKTLKITTLHNLQPIDAGRSAFFAGHPHMLRPVGKPVIIASGNWQIVGSIGTKVLLTDGSTLAWVNADNPGKPHPVCPFTHTVKCMMVSGNAITLMTDAGPFRLRCEGESFNAPGFMPRFPQISLAAVDSSEVSVTVTGGNTSTAGNRIMAAYAEMTDTAAARGECIHPVLACARLLDAEGTVLHTTAPVLLRHPKDEAPLRVFSLDTDDEGATVRDFDLGARTFRVAVHVDYHDDLQKSGVAAIEVLMTPQFGHIATQGVTSCEYSARARKVGVTLPATAHNFANGRNSLSATQVDRALRAFANLAEPVARYSEPGTYTLDSLYPATYANGLSAINAGLAKPAKTSSRLGAFAGATPFTASHVAVNGNATVWAGARVVGDSDINPAQWAVAFDTHPWSSVTRIRRADGSCTVQRHSGTAMPTLFSPVIAVPDPNAVEMTVEIRNAAGIPFSATWSLTPVNGTAYARVIPGAPNYIELSPCPSDIADSDARAVTHAAAEYILLADTRSPLAPKAAMEVPGVTAVVAGSSNGGGWQFGRERFYLFTDTEAHVLTAGNNRTTASLTLMTPCGVRNQPSVAEAPQAVYFLSGKRIFRVSRSAVKCVAEDIDAQFIAYDFSRNEVLAGTTDDSIIYHYSPDGQLLYTSDVAPHKPWHAGRCVIVAATAEGLASLTHRLPQNTNIQIAGVSEKKVPDFLKLDMRAAAASLTANISTAFLGTESATLNSTMITGEVRSPLILPTYATRLCHAPHIRVTVTGTVSPDAFINLGDLR